MFKKIAVALDGSRCAEEAFKVALELAHAERAQLAICSVVDPIMIAGSSPLPSPAMEIVIDDMERFAKRAGSAERSRGPRERHRREREDSLRRPRVRDRQIR